MSDSKFWRLASKMLIWQSIALIILGVLYILMRKDFGFGISAICLGCFYLLVKKRTPQGGE